jgi:hypothetical protein
MNVPTNLLGQPLLPYGEEGDSDHSERRSHRQGFRQQQQRQYLGVGDDGDDGRDFTSINKVLVHGLFGRAYATRWKFWWQHLPSSVCLGGIIGCAVGIFLWTNHMVTSVMFSAPTQLSEEQDTDTAVVMIHQNHNQHGDWRWIIATTGGAFLASVVMELPLGQKPECFRSIVNDLTTLEGNFVDSFYAVLSGWIALAFGLPLGKS